MRVWTIQPPEVVDILNNEGVFRCDEELSVNYADFYDAYNWLVNEMDNKGIVHPEGATLPMWAWHTRAWKNKKPDLRNAGLGEKGKKSVCLELEIPDEEVLLSDFTAWHYVLNNMWFDDSEDEDEWKKLILWYDSLEVEERDRLRRESWQRIFDVSPAKTDWYSRGEYVQATFWEIRKEMVKDIHYFTAR